MALTRENIQSLQVEETVKTDLLGLFDNITAREKTITELQAKVPKDSQKVVEDVDFKKFTEAQAELAKLKQQLAEKLANEQTADGTPILCAFASFF